MFFFLSIQLQYEYDVQNYTIRILSILIEIDMETKKEENMKITQHVPGDIPGDVDAPGVDAPPIAKPARINK